MAESRRRTRAPILGVLGALAFIATFGAVLSSSARAVGTNPTTTALASNANPAVYGQPVTLTAVVSPVAPATATPTGTVTFVNGVNTLGTRSVVNGTATYTTTYSVGTKSITANYNGDATYAVSTAPVLSQVINVTPTATTIVASANPTNLGSALTFTATAQAVAPGAGAPSSGSIKFYDGTTLLASKTPAVGVATFTTSTLAMGSHSITAAFFGSASYAASTSAVTNESVLATLTTTTVSSVANPSPFGSAVSATATVTATAGTPTGSVTFSEGPTVLATGPLTAGQATVSLPALPVGPHDITATYSGAPTFLASTSAPLTQTVDAAATATALGSDLDPAPRGAAVTLTATVSAASGTPTGTVTFTEGPTDLGSAPLSAGTGTLVVSSLPGGDHDITATYVGSGSYASSTSTPLHQVILATPTTTGVVAAPNLAPYGSAVTITATVSAPTETPTGSVTFFADGTAIGSGPVGNGIATITTSSLGVGDRVVTATFTGSTDFATSTSAPVTETVVVAPTTTTIESSVSTAGLGDPVVLTATITSTTSGASGTVTFAADGTPIGSGPLTGDTATITTSTLAVGSHVLTATYAGDTRFAGSTGAPIGVSVVGARAVTLISSSNPSAFGAAVTFTATVSGNATPTGTITFRDNATPIGIVGLVNGQAATTVGSLGVGSHMVTADYSGDGSNAPDSSAPLGQVVTRAATAASVAAAPGPSSFGQTVTFTATVTSTAGTPSGSVTVSADGTPVGTTTLANGTGTVTTATLGTGTHTIDLVYAGDTNFSPSAAASIGQTVNPVATVTSSSPSANPVAFGAPVTITATVTSAVGTPDGSVTLTDGAATLGTVPLTAGTGSFNLSNLVVGPHALVVTYSGSADYAPSVATTIAEAVLASSTTSLASSANPAPFGQSIDLTATVASDAGPPTGAVHFFDGTTDIGAATIAAGRAVLTTGTLAAGTHSLSATYLGDSTFAPSASAILNQAVSSLATVTTAVAAPARTVAGQVVTTTATVTAAAGTPTGAVTFRDGTTVLGTVPLTNGQASLSTSTLGVGVHTIGVTYAGDGSYASSVANATVTILDPTLFVNRASASCTNTGATAGTAATPFCAINSAAAKVSPGQTVQVAAGTYAEKVTVAVGGTSALPVTFTPAPGAAVSLTGAQNGFTMTNKSWVTIHGFSVDHTTAAGIVVSGSSNISIDANHVTSAGQPVNGATAQGIKIANSTDSIVTNNVTDHNSDAGILVTTNADNNVIAHNESFANARGYVRAAAGIDLRSSTGELVFGNRTHDNEDSGINVWTGLTDGSSTVYDNVSYSNGDHGIDVHNAVGAHIVANTVVNNSDSGIEMTTSQAVTLNNNITIDNGINSPRTAGQIRADKGAVAGGCVVNDDLVFLRTAGVMIDWNGVKYSSLAAFRTATGMESRGIQADPQFVSVAGADFHLQGGSPAIDSANSGAAGQPALDDDGSPRVDIPTVVDTGIGPITFADRGAYEYQP